MFASINKFKEKDFFDNGKIKIVTENGEETYEVFSVFVEKASDINLKASFSSNEEYNEYINSLKEKSYYKKEIKDKNNEVEKIDKVNEIENINKEANETSISNDLKKIITLYTCSYEFEDARTVVCATLVE